MHKRKKELVSKGILLTITFCFLGLLIISGSAQAFSLSSSMPETKGILGDNISFLVSLNINSLERLPVDYFTTEIFGSENIDCRFFPNGTAIFGCNKLNIEKISDANFTEGNLAGNYSDIQYSWGYGFGYGDGGVEKLEYNLTLNTAGMKDGIYETLFKTKIASNEFSKPGESIAIVKPVDIENLPSLPLCAYEEEDTTLRANITGSIKEVLVEINNGSLINYTTSKNENIYSAVAKSLVGNISWRFIVKDIANNLTYSDWQSILLVKRTELIVDKPNPDGLDGWYITEPLFTFENLNASKIYYKWDGLAPRVYSSPFRLEDSPNNGNITAGILELTYWGNTTCGMEEQQEEIFKVDLTNPKIKNLLPLNNSEIRESRPVVQAYLDDVYGENSGIDKESIEMELDGKDVYFNVSDVAGMDVKIWHNPAHDLLSGKHNITIKISDKAGRISRATWFFNINLTAIFNLTIISPKMEVYDSKKIIFNITTTENVLEILYINWNEKMPRWKILCRGCDKYGFYKKSTQTLKEGWNNLTIRATDFYGRSREENILLFIDSRQPIIYTTLPRRNSFVNGSEFYIKYSEDNLKNITLFYGKSESLTNSSCENGKSKECIFRSIDLTFYDNSSIDYYFEVTDSARTARSKTIRVKVDTTPPNLTVYSFKNSTYGRKVPFNITVSEDVLLEYYDASSDNPRWTRLTNNNNEYGNKTARNVLFSRGYHNITIRAVDMAGNSDTKQISFTVV